MLIHTAEEKATSRKLVAVMTTQITTLMLEKAQRKAILITTKMSQTYHWCNVDSRRSQA